MRKTEYHDAEAMYSTRCHLAARADVYPYAFPVEVLKWREPRAVQVALTMKGIAAFELEQYREYYELTHGDVSSLYKDLAEKIDREADVLLERVWRTITIQERFRRPGTLTRHEAWRPDGLPVDVTITKDNPNGVNAELYGAEAEFFVYGIGDSDLAYGPTAVQHVPVAVVCAFQPILEAFRAGTLRYRNRPNPKGQTFAAITLEELDRLGVIIHTQTTVPCPPYEGN